MLAPVYFFSLILLVVAVVRVRRWWQRRDDPPMVVTTWPDIEYTELYGGWNAEAYDAGTGRDRRAAPTGFMWSRQPTRSRSRSR